MKSDHPHVAYEENQEEVVIIYLSKMIWTEPQKVYISSLDTRRHKLKSD